MVSILYYRIPFSEVDAMNIVHHSNYARYFERGRVDGFRMLGVPYSEVMKRGFHIPLTSMETTFRRPVKFGEIILVETGVSELSGARFSFAYRLFVVAAEEAERLSDKPMDGEVHSFAVTHHCVVNDAGRPQPIPQDIFAALSKLKREDMR